MSIFTIQLRGRTVISGLGHKLLGRLLHSEKGSRRLKLAVWAMAANVMAKAFAFIVLLYSTHVAVEHLGPERFGVWMTISSIATLLSFVDLGISNAILNRATLLAGGTQPEANRVLTVGFVVLLAVGLVAAGALVSVFAFLPLDGWFKGISPTLEAEARQTGYVFAILFGFSLPAQGVAKVYSGLQQGWTSHTASAAAWVLSLALLPFAPRLDAGMGFYLFATYGLQQLVMLGLFPSLVSKGVVRLRGFVMPPVAELRKDPLLQQGRMFLFIQITVAIVWGSNQVILSAIVGPVGAAEFSVLQRFFMVLPVALAIFNGPLWAMYADAHIHGEAVFLRGLLTRAMAASGAVATVGSAVLATTGDRLIPLLATEAFTVPRSSILLMALWTILETCGNAFAMYLNGVGAIRPQAITAFAYMLFSVPLKIVGVIHWGLDGLLVVMVATYMMFTVVPFLTIFRGECFAALRLARSERRA